ncbi:zinc metalloproteinase nas-8-like [Cydia pomonella]|uniref:zinc metalloproteinase nas-8-like n=1 Tax=Cydia pomonella TaxID=82600 RepID=UPI002ADE31A2|nr:zinc metalloproteinase nas-8-like [Cydia pomonella]
MLPHGVCNYFRLCLLILLSMNGLSTLDISPGSLEDYKEITGYSKYYDDPTYSSGEDTNNEDSPINEVARPQVLMGKNMLHKKHDTRPIVDHDTEKTSAEEKIHTSVFNEKPDETEDIEKDDVSLLNDNYSDKENDDHTPSPSIIKKNIFSDQTKYDAKKLAALPGFKLSSSDIVKFKIWPEAKIPFFIDEFSYDKVLQEKIRGYLENARTLTGLNFVELASPPDDENERWVFFINRRGQLDCKDYSTKSFTNSGVQKVIIGYDCLQNNGPMAAIVLALAGVPPQHNAPNRDQYINVSMESILPEKRGLFKRLDDKDWVFHDLDYDYYSVGHYPSHKYTANGYATMTAFTKKKVLYMRHDEKDTYSSIDIQKIRLLYNNILRNLPRKDMKLEICKKLNQPHPSFPNMRLKSKSSIIEMTEPKKTLAEERKLMEPYYAILSSLEDYTNRPGIRN